MGWGFAYTLDNVIGQHLREGGTHDATVLRVEKDAILFFSGEEENRKKNRSETAPKGK